MYTSCVHTRKGTGGSVRVYTRSQFSFTIRGIHYQQREALPYEILGGEIFVFFGLTIVDLFTVFVQTYIEIWIKLRRGAASFEGQPMAG